MFINSKYAWDLIIFIALVIVVLLYFLFDIMRRHIKSFDDFINKHGILFVYYCLYSVLFYVFISLPFSNNKMIIAQSTFLDLKITLLVIKVILFLNSIYNMNKAHEKEIKRLEQEVYISSHKVNFNNDDNK